MKACTSDVHENLPRDEKFKLTFHQKYKFIVHVYYFRNKVRTRRQIITSSKIAEQRPNHPCLPFYRMGKNLSTILPASAKLIGNGREELGQHRFALMIVKLPTTGQFLRSILS